MKSPLVLFRLNYCCVPSAQPRRSKTQSHTKIHLRSEPLHGHPTVNDVIPLAQAGSGDDGIISQFQQKNAKFDFSADQIIRLNRSGMSSLTSQAIITTNSSVPNAPLSEAISSERPTSPHSPSVPPGIAITLTTFSRPIEPAAGFDFQTTESGPRHLL